MWTNFQVVILIWNVILTMLAVITLAFRKYANEKIESNTEGMQQLESVAALFSMQLRQLAAQQTEDHEDIKKVADNPENQMGFHAELEHRAKAEAAKKEEDD